MQSDLVTEYHYKKNMIWNIIYFHVEEAAVLVAKVQLFVIYID